MVLDQLVGHLPFGELTATSIPFFSIQGTYGAAVEAGLELLNFKDGLSSLFAYVGGGFSTASLSPKSGNINISPLATGFIYDTPTPEAYRGLFLMVSISGTHLLGSESWMKRVGSLPALAFAFSTATVSIFRGPFVSGGQAFSHGISVSTDFAQFGSNPTAGHSLKVWVS